MLPRHGTPGPRAISRDGRRRHGVRRQAIAFAAGFGVAACALIVATPPASADAAPLAHDPVGAITSAKAVPGGLQLTGWAYDPDAKAQNLAVSAKLDGTKGLGDGVTSVANAAVAKKYGTGPTPGWTLTVPMPTGSHTVCVAAQDLGPGTSVPVGCIPLPLGTSLSQSQLAKRLPTGAITSASADSSSVTYSGYATDPDWRNAHLRAVLYVDNQPVDTEFTNGRVTPAVAGTGTNSAFTLTAPVSKGTHVGCVWIVNVGLGTTNAFLGCQPVDTRGAAGTGTVVAPSLNQAVMTEALKHKGQPYSWGATGPSSFDCSGLVLYSYNKAVSSANRTRPAAQQMTLSVPRISEDQAKKARLIPASRAVPGDLVFMYDSEGDVYHVGLYASPGKMFAAIDYGYGVNYQTIWDPTSVFYGSLTHT